MNKLLLRIFAALFVGLFPVLANAQFQADLTVENFSVYSTLPDSSGFGRVSVSFRVVNRGRSSATASTTRVTFDNNITELATPGLSGAGFLPRLAPPGAAYMTRVTRSTASQIAITIQADALNAVAENNETNNRLQFTAVLTQQAGRWLSIGPSRIQDPGKRFGDTFGVGRVTTIAVDPRSPTIIYAGAQGSGLWKSFTAGSIWFPIGDSLPSAQIYAIGIAPKDPNRVVIATPAGVFESRDGGSVWTLLTSEDLKAVGSDGGALLIENRDNPALYISTTNGLRVSVDGGHTWPTVLGNGMPIVSLQFSTTNPTHLFASVAGAGPGGGRPGISPMIFEAKDRGLTSTSWHRHLGCGPDSLGPMPLNSAIWVAESQGRLYVSFRETGRAKTEDNKFELLRSIPSRRCQRDGFTEFAWEKISLGGTCGKYANHFSYLFAHPTDPALVLKAGVDLCRSTTFGAHLAPVAKIHLDHHAVAFSASAPGLLFFGTDGGIYRSADKGKTMEFIGEGFSNTEFLKIDVDGKGPHFIVGGSQDNGTSTFSGLSPVWTYVGGGDSTMVEFDRADLTGIYEVGQSTRQVQRIKPGSNSQKLGDSKLPDCCAYTAFPAAVFDSMLSTGGSPRLVVTCQGIWTGPPWRQIQSPPFDPIPTPKVCMNPPSGDFRRLKLHPSGIIVAVTNTGHVFHGILSQPPFREIGHADPEASPSAISFDGPGRFYISVNRNPGQTEGKIVRFECFIECNHESVPLTSPFPSSGEITAMTTDPLEPNTLLAAVRNRGVFRGTRIGPNNWTWIEYNNGLPFGVTVTDLEPQNNGGIIAATYGRGAFRLFSKIEERPPNPTARGRITSYENLRADPDRPPGPNNQRIETIEIDSRPGFLFTAISPTGRFRFIAQKALRDHRIVTIEFTPISAQSGNIISIR